VSAHAPGAFSWVELATTDPKGAVTFYRTVFGWDVVEHDMGPDGVYTIFTVRGRDVAAAAGQHPQEREMRVPPHWNLYVSVPDADAAAARVAALGGKVEAPPFDVMNHGRMAVIQDPTGAMVNLWQPKAHIGVRTISEPGALCWSELTTRDPQAAEAFYRQMFGWEIKPSGEGTPAEYREFSVGGQPIGGIMKTPTEVPAHVPSYWMPYFQVADLDTALSTARSNGGTAVVGPAPIPGTGRFVVLTDPQGAMFALFQR
jgi:predicted enzyme related to lactoylglutathione lyase